jgi:hypothetical protein
MNAHEIIDRLARMDEAFEQPTVEPGTIPEEPTTQPDFEPGPDRSPGPYELPPDFDPDAMPHPKAGDDNESETIRNWLEVTQQPVKDWDWDGEKLQMMLDDGSIETYSRQELDQAGVFGGEMAFAESTEDEDEDDADDDEGDKNDFGPENCPTCPDEPSGDEATGVLDQILGRCPCASEPSLTLGCGPGCDSSAEFGGEGAPGSEVIEIEGTEAEKLNTAITDVVSAILGIVGGKSVTGEAPPEGEEEKEEPPKSKKSKSKDKKKDKAKKDDDDADDEDGEDDEDDDSEDEKKDDDE